MDFIKKFNIENIDGQRPRQLVLAMYATGDENLDTLLQCSLA